MNFCNVAVMYAEKLETHQIKLSLEIQLVHEQNTEKIGQIKKNCWKEK